MTFTQGRYIIADTDSFGARDMPNLVAQVKLMREAFEDQIGKQPGLIIIVVDDSERKAASRRILGVLDAESAETEEEALRRLLFESMLKLHKFVTHAGTDFEDMVIEALNLPPCNSVDYARYWYEVSGESGY